MTAERLIRVCPGARLAAHHGGTMSKSEKKYDMAEALYLMESAIDRAYPDKAGRSAATESLFEELIAAANGGPFVVRRERNQPRVLSLSATGEEKDTQEIRHDG